MGRIRDAEPIEWQHKSTYAFSRMRLSQPVVSVNEDGWIVAAHRFEPPDESGSGPAAEQMAATDTPTADWYQTYTSGPTVAV